MINLLPPATKKTLTAGRVNALLVRYIWITLALFGLLAALCGLAYIMLENTKQSAEQQLASNNASVQILSDIKQRADTFKANLATSKTILDQQTHYTDTILKISALMTQGTTIDSLSLDQSTYGTPLTLQISAVDQTAIINLKRQFQDSSMFSDVHFQSLSIAGGGDQGAQASYPIKAQLVVTINKDGI